MSGQSTGSTGIAVVPYERELEKTLLETLRSGWASGQPVTATQLLKQHPELARRRVTVLELARAEFLHRLQVEENLDLEAFCEEFGDNAPMVREMIVKRRFMLSNPGLAPKAEPHQWPEVGDIVSGFDLLDELGRGSFARVYLATEPALGNRPVAVKFSLEGECEAETLGKLRHPNVVPVHSVFHDKDTGLSIICMPFLGQATLGHVLWRVFGPMRRPQHGRDIIRAIAAFTPDWSLIEPLPLDPAIARRTYVEAVVHLAIQLAEALGYMHSHGICHRDLKPSNVLMTPDGRPMLLDFNLSLDEQTFQRRLGGTVPYMAPGPLRQSLTRREGEIPEADPRDDLFSLGVLMYEMLCGSYPFGELDPQAPADQVAAQLMLRQAKGPAPLANPDVDPALAGLVARCLAFDPEDRPQSGMLLAAELRRAVSPPRRARRWLRLHRGRAATAAATLLTAGSLAGYALANQPPAAQRHLAAARAAYQADDLETAHERYTRVIELDPASRSAWFERARTYHRQGNYALAIEDYNQARKLDDDAQVHACLADCRAKSGDSDVAIAHYHRALAMGYETPEVLNNLALLLMNASRMAEAGRLLERALQLDPAMQAAWHNRVLLEFKRARRAGRPTTPQASQDVLRALNSGPATGRLLIDAARACAQSPGDAEDRIQSAMDFLWQAIDQGVDLRQYANDGVLRPFLGESRWKSLLEKPSPSNVSELSKPQKSQLLVDPLGEDWQPAGSTRR